MFEDEDKIMIDSYIERGKKVIPEDKLELWKKLVKLWLDVRATLRC